MTSSGTDVLAPLRQARDLLNAALRHTKDTVGRDRLIAEALQALRPWAPPIESGGLTGQADVGELAGPVMHEVSNFLNTVLLHLAVLEPDLPPHLRTDVGEIRGQGTSLTALLNEFRQYRRRRQGPFVSVDLNQIVNETVAATAAEVPVQLQLVPGQPCVQGAPADVQRLVTFLLMNALAVSTPGRGTVTLRTEQTAEKVFLHVEDTGPTLVADALAHLFEPGGGGRAGTNHLEMAALKRIVQRLQGKIQGSIRPEGGIAIYVEMPRWLEQVPSSYPS